MNLFHGISSLIGWVTTLLTSIIGISPISLDVSSTSFLLSGLVKGSTKFNYNLTNSRDITLVSSSCRTILCLRHICLFFPLNILLLPLAIVAWLSQHIDTDEISLVHKGIFVKRFLTHSTLKLAFSKAINSSFLLRSCFSFLLLH